MVRSSEWKRAAFLAGGFGAAGDAAGTLGLSCFAAIAINKGAVTLNFVVLHWDVTGRIYRVLFVEALLKSAGALNDIECMRYFQMNHVGNHAVCQE